MTLQARLSEIEEKNLHPFDRTIISRKVYRLVSALRVAIDAIKCNETFHRLGGIDDCEPCQALTEIERILEGKNE